MARIEGKACCIAVDVQSGCLDPNSQFYDPEYVEVVKRDRMVLDKCREVGVPIIYLQEVHRDNGFDFGRELEGDENKHCLEGSPYTAVAEKELARIPDEEPIVQKRRYSGFLYTELEVCLSGFGVHPGDTLILIGGFTDVCVHYTFVDAHQRDYRLRVVKDCLEASSKERGEAALEAMRYLQHAAPVSLDEILEQLDEYGKEHPKKEEDVASITVED